MLNQLIHALVGTPNQAADDVLLQALRIGAENEQRLVLDLLLKRGTPRGMNGIIAAYDTLPESLQASVVANVRRLNHALAECGRSDTHALRLSAMRLIAAGRQGRLAYVLSENLHNSDAALSKAATDAIVALARWVATETKRLNRGVAAEDPASPAPARAAPATLLAEGSAQGAALSAYDRLMVERPEIEAAVARAINVHRGKHGPDLLRAGLLLADWPGSQTLAILHTAKHGGQGPMVRRLQQPPDSENVAAFLLGASHGQLRSHFGAAFSHVDHAPVLDALLRKTHWVKDAQLQTCLHQVTRGTWWGLSELRRDAERRTAAEAASIADWLACSGLHDVEQDERSLALLDRAKSESDVSAPDSIAARLRLLRVAMRRRRGASVELIRALLSDPDERIVRMAAREIVRRKPADFENTLLKMMTSAAPALRRVIGTATGQAGFEGFWLRFDGLDKSTRKQAGKAMLKLLPDALQRLQRRALSGPVEQRIKAMQIVQELGVAETLRETLIQLCADTNARVRSKAITVLGELAVAPNKVLIERLLQDNDARVRANAVEVLEDRGDPEFIPALAQRALGASGRERANAIKAMHRMKVGTAGSQLFQMLHDARAEHRISAMWAMKQIGWWQLLNEVGRLARADDNPRVRRYAVGVLKTVSEMLKERKKVAG